MQIPLPHVPLSQKFEVIEHCPPSAFGVKTQPLAGSQEPVEQGSGVVQSGGVPCWQKPFWQNSVPLHGLLSPHGPFAATPG